MRRTAGVAVTAVVVVCILAFGIFSSAKARAEFRTTAQSAVIRSGKAGPQSAALARRVGVLFLYRHFFTSHRPAGLSSDASRFTPAQATQIAQTEFDH